MTHDKHHDSSDYKCAYCGRQLDSLDEVCDCGNALGVMDL